MMWTNFNSDCIVRPCVECVSSICGGGNNRAQLKKLIICDMNWKKIILISITIFGIFLIFNIQKRIPEINSTNGFELILKDDQHDPDLITYVKTNVIKKPSNQEYKLKNPNKSDYSQFKEVPFLLQYFKDKENGTFIEAGAFDGEKFSNTLNLEKSFGWRGLLIEPNPLEYQLLLTKNRKSYHTNCCLSLTPRTSEVYMRLWGSKTDIIENPPESRKGVLAPVKCYPLYTLMVATNLTTVDFFSLDVEGVEMKILGTIPWNDVNIKTFLIENDLIPEGKEFLKKFMETKGYEMIKQIDRNYFFVKKNLKH